MNESAKANLTEVITIDGKDYLRYLPISVSVALLRGSYADEDGNISLEEEPANLDIYAMAAAAHNSGGKVIFQVKGRVPSNSMKAREVRIPAALVDAVVIDERQQQGYELVYDAAVSGQQFRHDLDAQAVQFSPRLVIAKRARQELIDDAVINFGFGIPDQVAKLIAYAMQKDVPNIENRDARLLLIKLRNICIKPRAGQSVEIGERRVLEIINGEGQ